MSNEPSLYLKIILLGNIDVGKTSVLLRFTEGTFSEKINGEVDKKNRDLTINGKTVRLTIHDTAGQERFRTLTSSYYRNADAIIICYDVTEVDSFNEVEGFLKEGVRYARKAEQFLLGNKIDLESKRAVSTDEGKALATKLKIPFHETSAKTGAGIDEFFTEIARTLMDNAMNKPTVPQVDLGKPPAAKKGFCNV